MRNKNDINNITEEDRKLYDTLARYFSAAFIANRMGISLGYALKAYVENQDVPPGLYWYRLSKQATRDVLRQMDQILEPVRTPEAPPS